MTTGEKIRFHRRKLGLTIKQLASKSGVSVNSIGFYEKGKAEPSLFVATCIADVLNVSLDYLAGRKEK